MSPVQATKTLVEASEQTYSSFVCTPCLTMELNQKLSKKSTLRRHLIRGVYICKNLEVKVGGGRLLEGAIFWELTVWVWCPDHTLSQEKGSGDFLGCGVNSEEAILHHVSWPCNEIGYIKRCNHWSTVDTANSTQPRKCSTVTRPYSSWEGWIWTPDYSDTGIVLGGRP